MLMGLVSPLAPQTINEPLLWLDMNCLPSFNQLIELIVLKKFI